MNMEMMFRLCLSKETTEVVAAEERKAEEEKVVEVMEEERGRIFEYWYFWSRDFGLRCMGWLLL